MEKEGGDSTHRWLHTQTIHVCFPKGKIKVLVMKPRRVKVSRELKATEGTNPTTQSSPRKPQGAALGRSSSGTDCTDAGVLQHYQVSKRKQTDFTDFVPFQRKKKNKTKQKDRQTDKY